LFFIVAASFYRDTHFIVPTLLLTLIVSGA
jgi:hypothetical protein